MHDFAEWLANTNMSHWLQTASWVIPLSQTIHILAIGMVLSSIVMVDLRILGLGARSQTLPDMLRRFAPWIWTGLVLLLLTGTVQIVAEPGRALDGNPAFQLKMLMLALAIVATLALQASVRRNAAIWHEPRRRKAAGALVGATLLLWCAIIVAGRWIAYLQAG